jgi:hypothetical protein
MMAGHGEKRSRRYPEAIVALMTEPTMEAAARQAGISANTLGRWMREPAFLTAYRDVRRTFVESAIARIQNATGEAVDALRRNLTCGRSGDEIRAAVAILDHASRGVELMDLAERLDALESRLTDGTAKRVA